jgi:hypothetical protein
MMQLLSLQDQQDQLFLEALFIKTNYGLTSEIIQLLQVLLFIIDFLLLSLI